ncbi:tetratricopeptide repeat protein [Nocardia sp. NPDC052001]|uniref:tetratricopeptide repeat protein n=1 Tax=Nocardia sp. NPDC052001 TaxID=3154853 RepID=UPI003442B685
MDSRIERAGVLVQLGRPEAARELLAEVLAGEPENLWALALMADIEYRLGDYQRSLRYSGDALRSLPENASLWRSRAAAFWMLGRRAAAEPETARRYYADALANALRAVQIDGEDVASLRILAVTQAESDPDTALATVGRALEIDAEDAALHSLYATVLYSLKSRGAEFIERARAAYHESLRLEPNSAEALYHLGVIDFEHGDRSQAAERLHMAARIDPYYAESARHYLHRIKHEYRADGFTLVYSDPAAASSPEPEPESESVPAPAPSGPTGEWNAEALAELRRFDPERWRETTPESFDAAVAALHDLLALDPRNAAAAHELALADWLCGRRGPALTRLHEVAQWDSERAEQVSRHIALIESQPVRAVVPSLSPPEGEWNEGILAELRLLNAEHWRVATAESFVATVTALREMLRADPENAAAAHELALADWLCGRRRAALARLRKVAQWDSGRAEEVARHIGLIESEVERAETARVEREIAAEAVRVRAREQARQRRARSRAASTREKAAATRLHRPRRWGGSALLLFPILLFVRLVASGCSSDSSGHQPPTVTNTRYVPPYNPATDPAFVSFLRSPPPVVPHG